MKSQIQKQKKEWWNCRITNTNIFPKKFPSHEGTKIFLGKEIMERLF